GQRAGHARAETRVLVEDGGQQGAARAWQAGNEVELPGRLRDVVCGRHAGTLLWRWRGWQKDARRAPSDSKAIGLGDARRRGPDAHLVVDLDHPGLALVKYAKQQFLGRTTAHLAHGLMDGGKRWPHLRGDGRIIESADRHVAGNRHPGFRGGPDRTDGHVVV